VRASTSQELETRCGGGFHAQVVHFNHQRTLTEMIAKIVRTGCGLAKGTEDIASSIYISPYSTTP
jgi:hypothetical protein